MMNAIEAMKWLATKGEVKIFNQKDIYILKVRSMGKDGNTLWLTSGEDLEEIIMEALMGLSE